MHRFFIYDETIQEHHLFSPEVFIEDPDKRAGVALYLEGLGYDIECASVYIGGLSKKNQFLSYDRIEHNDILSIDKWGKIMIGCYSDRDEENHREKVIAELNKNAIENRYIIFDDGTVIDLNRVSCEDNIELFKVLTLYRDDTDYGKLIYYENPKEGWYEHNHTEKDRLWINCQWDNFEKDCDVAWVKERCKMLYTLDDILKYKDLL